MAIEYLYFMPKATKKLKRNVLGYEPKVRFDGTFEDLLRISATDAG